MAIILESITTMFYTTRKQLLFFV